MRGLPGNSILNDQALPNRINGRGIRQEVKHALDSQGDRLLKPGRNRFAPE
jgi:hypothetical protein